MELSEVIELHIKLAAWHTQQRDLVKLDIIAEAHQATALDLMQWLGGLRKRKELQDNEAQK